MYINKILGMISFIIGSILILSLYTTGKESTFAFSFILGPLLIYLGLKSLTYI